MNEVLRRTAEILDGLSERTGRVVAWLTLTMVAVTFLVVLMRYAFDFGRIWVQETATWMHAFVFMLGAAYTLKHDEHVRVDVFYRAADERRRAWTDLLGSLFLLLPTCVYVFWSSFDYVIRSWTLLEASRESGGMPGLFILKTAIPAMAVLLILQGLAEAARAVLVLRGGLPRREDRGAGGRV